MDETITVPVEVEHTATVPVDAVAPEEPALDPNRLIEADVAIQREEQETERARIEARTAVKIAEINAEETAWKTNIEASLAMLTARLDGLQAATEQNLLSPQITVAETITTVAEGEGAAEGGSSEAMQEEGEDQTAEQQVTEATAEAPERPARRPGRRWI